MIDHEEFEAWLAHPATVKLMEKCDSLQRELEQAWLAASWHTEIDVLQKIDIGKLAYLRGKSMAFKSLAKLSYKDLYGKIETAGERK
jgi:hypothetical protein